MPLARSLADAVDKHRCFAAHFEARDHVDCYFDPLLPPVPGVIVQCQDCLQYRASVPISVCGGMQSSQLQTAINQHYQTTRGYAYVASGYFARGPGFWLNAVYWAFGAYLIDGRRSATVGAELDLLLLGLQHQVLPSVHPQMLDRTQYKLQSLWLDESVPLTPAASLADLLAQPQLVANKPSKGAYRQVVLAEFLPTSAQHPAPATNPPVTKPAAKAAPVPPPAKPKPLQLGDICPICGEAVKVRMLLKGSYVGCMC